MPLLLTRLQAIHDALDAAGFDHAVGGGIALAHHVEQPRFTADIDLNILADPDHPEHVLAAMPAAILVQEGAADELRSRGQVRLFWPEPTTPVDIFLPQHHAYHQLVTDRAMLSPYLGEGIKVLSATDLIVFKTLFDRSKDWVDIESMLENGAGDIDEVRIWLTEFLGPDDTRIARLDRLQTRVLQQRR